MVDALASARPIATSVLSTSTVAPPWERIAPPTTSKRGWTNPNSGRRAYSTRSGTDPRVQRTWRSNTPGADWPKSWPRSRGPNAIASITMSSPAGPGHVVSSTSPGDR